MNGFGTKTFVVSIRSAKVISSLRCMMKNASGFKSWNTLWKLQLPPKVKNFLWRSVTGTLPVSSHLHVRRVNVELNCPRCADATKTMEHAFQDCPMASQVWAISPFSDFQRYNNPSLYGWRRSSPTWIWIKLVLLGLSSSPCGTHEMQLYGK